MFRLLFDGFPFLLSALIILTNLDENFPIVHASAINMENMQRSHRPPGRIQPHLPMHFGKVRSPLTDFMDDDDLFDLSKRQVTDDYGHLRFGKRGEDFDDYGHLRFGRSRTD